MTSQHALRGVPQPLAAHVAAGLPSGRDANWKYANLRSLERFSFAPPPRAASAWNAVDRAAIPAPLDGFERIVILDGSPRIHSGGRALRATVRAPSTPPTLVSLDADARFERINHALADHELELEAAGAEPLRCELLFLSSIDARVAASQPRVRVRVRAGANLTLVERHASLPPPDDAAAAPTSTWCNSSLQVMLDDGASLQHLRLQHAGESAYLHETLHVTVGQHARYSHRSVDTGARWSRLTAAIQLDGADAHLQWSAVDATAGTQQHDAALRVEHRGARARTDQVFRGVASGRSHIGFSGHLIVRDSARGAALTQSLRSLLAGPGCECNVRPQLEIYTDEVRASHGATAGTLDESMRFYLMSRGLSADAAAALLKWAFVEDVLAGIEAPSLRRATESAVAQRLDMAHLLQQMQ
jgi:Fe-S cluster assembly protein SufD